jgi:UDP:flavonoid glycosyltransferase YjiC (YdhE family)
VGRELAVISVLAACRGHEVVIATEERMADFVKSYSLPFKKIAGDPQAMVYDKDCQASTCRMLICIINQLMHTCPGH